MSDLQKNLTAAGASAESAEKIAGIIKAAAQASALTPVELNRCLRIGADEARRIYYWEKKHAPLLPAGGGERLKEIKKLFTDRGLAADDERFKHILLEAPSLLFLPASTIEDNIKSLCRFPGLPAIDEETYRRAALKQPRLLCLRPQTIADNIRGLVNHPALCGREGKPLLKCREYIAAALKRPQLLYQLPETLAANVSGVVSHPALKDDDGKPLFTTETYLQTALKKPQLFLHAPETVVEHVTRFLRHPAFADENGNSLIKAGDYRKAVLRHPALLLQNPDLAAANISGVVNHPLLAAADGSPVFSFNVSYQGHGPYSDQEVYRGLHFTDGRFSQESANILDNYLGSVQDTAENLRALLDSFDTRPEPVVVVVYGDHKPWLGNNGSVYAELGIPLDTSDEAGLFGKYSTDYLLWGNAAARALLGEDAFSGEGETISPNFLMNLVFDRLDWQGNAWAQFTDSVRQQMPVLTTIGRFAWQGQYLPESDLPQEAKDLLNRYRQVQYYYENRAKPD